MSVLKFMFVVPCLLALAACGGSGKSLSCSTTSTGTITLDGTIQYQRVPHFPLDPTKSQSNYPAPSSIYGLDYAATTDMPARGVTVQVVNMDNNSVIASTSADTSGYYSLSVPNNTMIKVRVLAQLSKIGALPNWDFSVKDNTNGNAIYAMEGSAHCTGSANETDNLTADSGWTGTSYTNARTAAPFAILDTIYDGTQLILGADSTARFPALSAYWSANNTDTFGNVAVGQIGTSYFNGSNGIYILGDQDVDTDEYDPSVIAHEWGHYIEANFSRSDSIGGIHYGGDYLDMRVAFGEGFGNAFSSMVRNNPWYTDSSGSAQGSGFGFNVETEQETDSISASKGWYSESSVEKILYDLYDSTNDLIDADTLSLGFQPIWNVLITDEKTLPVFTSIFKFIDILKMQDPGDATAIDNLVNARNIHVTDVYGTGESNNASNSSVLPVYNEVTTSTPATNVCVTNAFRRGLGTGDYNVLGMNHFLRFTPSSDGTYTITVNTPSTPGGDPDIYFYNGTTPYATSADPGSESINETLTGGTTS